MSDADETDNKDNTHLHSPARQARRKKFEERKHKSHESILIPATRRSTPLLLFPWGTGAFPVDYNERLPEWRIRAGHSALQEHWRNWREFQLAVLATTWGFTNVLYFPILAIAYGRGTYVFVFIVAEFLIGYPLVFFELALGQYTSKDVVRVFSLFPLSEGVGLSLMLKSMIRVITFNFYFAWVTYYIYRCLANIQFTPTFAWKAPWEDCVLDELDRIHLLNCGLVNVVLHNNTEFLCAAVFFNDIALKPTPNCTTIQRVPTDNDVATINWPLIFCLGLLAMLSFIIIIKGIKSIGYFVTWIVPTSYVTLLIILIAVLCYKGALGGVLYLFTPDFRNVDVFEMLAHVVIQVMQSLSLDTGGMIVVGSYAHFQSLAHYHALGACVGDVSATLLTASIFFGLMGITATNYNIEIYDLLDRSTLDLDLSIFTIMSSAVARMRYPLFWALLFFVVLACMVESATICETLVFLKPVYHTVRLTEPRRHVINVCAVLGMFLLTLPLTTRDGVVFYQLSFLHRQQLKYSAILIVMFAVTFIIYGYGLRRLRHSIDFMTEYLPNKFFSVMWLSLPFLLLALFVSVLTVDCLKNDSEEGWIGWTVFILVFIPIPAVAIWKLVAFSKEDKLVNVLRPRDEGQWSRVSVDHDSNVEIQGVDRAAITRAEALLEFLRATEGGLNKGRTSSSEQRRREQPSPLLGTSNLSSRTQLSTTDSTCYSYRHVSFSQDGADVFGTTSGVSSSSGVSEVTDSDGDIKKRKKKKKKKGG